MPTKKSPKKTSKKKKTIEAKENKIEANAEGVISEQEEKTPSKKINSEESNADTISKHQKIKKIKLDKIDFHSKKLQTSLLWVSIVLPTLLLGIYYYVQYVNTQSELVRFKQNPQAAAVYDLLEKIEQHVQLPKNETPTIATITDVDKLKDQPFFSKAQNGDKILMYEKSERTIIYRPLIDRIIETASISIANSQELTSGEIVTPEAKESSETVDISKTNLEGLEESVKIVIYNGTGIPGLANSLRQKLNDRFEGFDFEVLRVGNAANAYDRTSVYNVIGIKNEKVASIKDFINAEELVETPNENTTSMDLLIIIGKDFRL